MKLSDQKLSAHVSFTRPEKSLCLGNIADTAGAEYKEALALIEAGKKLLQERPRADMPGFQLVSQIEIDQEAKYRIRLQIETEMRTAIVAGQKQYEEKKTYDAPQQ